MACPLDPSQGDAGMPLPRWFALRVRSNREFRVAEELAAAGFESFLPTWSEQVRWSDRNKTVHRPLFPGYLFVREASRDIRAERLHEMSSVISLLPDDLNPSPIPTHELDAVRLVMASGLPAAPCEFVAGELVTIDSGPLAGISGVVVKTAGTMSVVVSIEILRRSVRVTLGAETLQKKAA